MTRGQRYKFVNRTGIILGAIALAVFGIEAAIAVSNHQLVVGFNYWNAPLFSLTQLLLAIVFAPFLLRYALRHWNDEQGSIPKD